MSDPSSDYAIGIMTLDVEGKDSDGFRRLVDRAVRQVEATLTGDLALRTDLFAFEGPHLVPGAGAYAPLDFLQIGIAEKLERRLPFLLIVTEVDLTSSSLAYALALPSQLTNVGVVSTKRLDPGFWGDDPAPDRAASRLTSLLLHTFGHLLNLAHDPDRSNVMYPVEQVEDLDGMNELGDAQREQIRVMLPREAHDSRAAGTSWRARAAFTLKTLAVDAGSIARAVARANPLRLATRMPTMIAAGLSVIIVLLFGAETWDVAAAVTMPQVLLFSAVSFGAAAFVLYRAFAIESLLGRDRRLAESTVVTAAATVLSLVATLGVLFVAFAGLMYIGVITVFPEQLMETWATVGAATDTLDHVKLSLFLAAMGVLAGSLGGRSDSRDLVRGVLFLTEES
ncbi:hypothetical protein [Rubrivirga sp. IMCC43871]|uniref:hypothetical protein n=1 Tax=Rubrivirga sp. IMCC43871 TaxID=3391575 RepID=UPI00399034EA